MPHERLPPDQPLEWLHRARSDLAIASASVEGAYLEDLCYHAQQCAEKALKAVLLHRRGAFPYIHDLAELVNQVQQLGVLIPDDVRNAVVLTDFSVEGRYPGFDEPVTEDQWREASRLATSVLEWSAQIIETT